MLPISGLMFLILGLFGLLKAHRGHLGTSDQCFFSLFVSPSCYLLIPSHLNHLNSSGYNKMPLLILRLLFGVLFGLFKTHEGPLGTPNQYFLLCMCSPSRYLPILCQLRLNTCCTRSRNIFIFFPN
jgi:hypothetical protein